MSSNGLAWSYPVTVWWAFLLLVSALNVVLWLTFHREYRRRAAESASFFIQPMLLLCAAYVFGCAFRSVLPRADVERICLFDAWYSSVMVGRSVATVAEVCFAAQWALVLRQFARLTESELVENLSRIIVPLIVLAECCSWYSVVTTSYLGNTVENSIWAAVFLLILIALVRLVDEFTGLVRIALAATVVGIVGYVAFLAMIDVPMYFLRWQADAARGKDLLGLASGLYDAGTRWVATRAFVDWKDEIAWMSLYFSAGVWSSLALCGFDLVKHQLDLYRASSAIQLEIAPRI